jgi:CheY-like chemotaxis protein
VFNYWRDQEAHQSSLNEETSSMKLRILSLSADQELTLLRKRVLESAGHEVVAPLSDKEALEAASEKNRFDVAIVCYRMWTGKSRQVMRIFRKNNADGKFLVMVRVYGENPELEGDRYVVGADGPDALLGVVNEMRTASVKAPALE